jgi:hypothetical protein
VEGTANGAAIAQVTAGADAALPSPVRGETSARGSADARRSEGAAGPPHDGAARRRCQMGMAGLSALCGDGALGGHEVVAWSSRGSRYRAVELVGGLRIRKW